MDKLEDPIYDMTYSEMQIWNKFCELRDIQKELEVLKDNLSRERLALLALGLNFKPSNDWTVPFDQIS